MTLPNQLTVLRIVLTPVAVFLFLMEEPLAKMFATGVFIIASFTDWYDGYVARKYNTVTDWGKFLDPLADKILILSMLLCFVIMDYVQLRFVLIIVIRDVVITAIRSYMMLYNQPIAANIFGKIKTFAQTILVYLIMIYVVLDVSLSPETLSSGFSWTPNFLRLMTEYIAYFTLITGIIYLFQNFNYIWDAVRKVGKFAGSPSFPSSEVSKKHTDKID